APRVLDLRYEWERGLCHIKGDAWVDFNELIKGGAGLGPDEELVLYCKGQSKSAAAFKALRDKGYSKVSVLKGGIDAWAEKIEKGMTRY
ncbi:MAG: rhodanese-like domain-containing protein, partial [Elusimicrobia bacterium]|nr:rhodanese-like domain-containing protein [Elusimicrobiota bacterium]